MVELALQVSALYAGSFLWTRHRANHFWRKLRTIPRALRRKESRRERSNRIGSSHGLDSPHLLRSWRSCAHAVRYGGRGGSCGARRSRGQRRASAALLAGCRLRTRYQLLAVLLRGPATLSLRRRTQRWPVAAALKQKRPGPSIPRRRPCCWRS